MFSKLKALLLNPPSLARNIAWMAWSGTISVANSVIVWMLMARWREAAEMGRFTLVMSIYLLFFTICSLGLNPYLVAEISRRSMTGEQEISKTSYSSASARLLLNATLLLLVWSLLCVGGMNALTFTVSAVSEVRLAAFLMSMTMPFTALTTVADSYLTAKGRTNIIAAAVTTENVMRTVLPIGLLLQGQRLSFICASFVVARLLAVGVYVVALRSELLKLWRARIAAQWIEIKSLLRIVPTFAAITVLAAVHLQLAVILLGRWSTEQEAAMYGVASRFLIPFAILMSSYAAVLQPEAARKAVESARQLADFLSRSLGYVLAGAVVTALTLGCAARPILNFLFGEKYAHGALTLGILLASIVPFCGVMILARGLVALQKQHVDFVGNAAAVGTSLILGAWLIPRYGATGAAIAHLLSMVVLFGVELSYLWAVLFRVEGLPLWARLGKNAH